MFEPTQLQEVAEGKKAYEAAVAKALAKGPERKEKDVYKRQLIFISFSSSARFSPVLSEYFISEIPIQRSRRESLTASWSACRLSLIHI